MSGLMDQLLEYYKFVLVVLLDSSLPIRIIVL